MFSIHGDYNKHFKIAQDYMLVKVLPGLMNEYRVPELNVQNGVLKALSFLFEYIGEMGKDYIYAVTPLFEDALQERDLVHRQVLSFIDRPSHTS